MCDSVAQIRNTSGIAYQQAVIFSYQRNYGDDDPLERFFYELECIKGTWSVRELRRQIDTKLFFRAGISKKPELLLEKIEKGGNEAVLPIKNVYALEFLGLDGKEEETIRLFIQNQKKNADFPGLLDLRPRNCNNKHKQA